MPLKILSWNVNGLRSFKQPMIDFLNDLNSDIICMQETKITRDMLSEDLAIIRGFTSYFSFSRKRSGYSGVATYAKDSCSPIFASEGLCGTLMPEMRASASIQRHEYSDEIAPVIAATHSALPGEWTKQTLKDIDNEGRSVITIHRFCGATSYHYYIQCPGWFAVGESSKTNTDGHSYADQGRTTTIKVPTDEAAGESSPPKKSDPVPLAIINVYCPRADPERADRGLYKLQFYRALRLRAALLAEAGARVVIVGDLNTAHQRLDHCDPDEDFHLNPGRRFLDALLVEPHEHGHVPPSLRVPGSCSSLKFSQCEKPDTSVEKSYPEVNSSMKETDRLSLQKNLCDTENDNELLTGQDESWSDHGKSENQIVCEESSPPSLNEIDLDHSQDDEETDPLMRLKIYQEFRMVDTFRSLYPKKKDAFSCWNTKASARATNYGTRIDYVLCDELFFHLVMDSLVLQDVMGSDHCPVACICRVDVISADKLPPLCSKNFVEFQGEQQNLFSYFQKVNPVDKAQNIVAVNTGDQMCITSKNSEETCDSPKERKFLDSFFIKNTKAREPSCQDSTPSEGSVSHKGATRFSSPASGEKRKNSFGSNKGVKNKQSKLISFFASCNTGGSTSQSTASLTRESSANPQAGKKKLMTDVIASASVVNNGQLSLYEAELKYLRENPDIYNQLNLGDDGKINMDLFIRSEDGDIAKNTKSDVESVPDSKFPTSNISVESNVLGEYNRSVLFSNSISTSENHADVAFVSDELPSSSGSDDGYTSTFTPETSLGNGNVCEPVGPAQMERTSEIKTESDCRNSSSVPARSGITTDWSFLGKKVVAPLCFGHKEPAVLRTSKKKGVNFNRKFYACARGAGRPGQKDAQCNFFKWV